MDIVGRNDAAKIDRGCDHQCKKKCPGHPVDQKDIGLLKSNLIPCQIQPDQANNQKNKYADPFEGEAVMQDVFAILDKGRQYQ